VDELVSELARQYRQGDAGRSAAPADTWTSRPLTMTLTPFESRGRVAFREGEHELLLQSLGQVLAEGARVRLVERAVMDKLLGELKLGSSALADPATALRLGRLLSARLISVGTIAGTGSSWQLTVRLIETETSVVAASTAQTFPLSVRTTDAAEQAGRRLVDQVARTFPLRARVVQARGGEVTLNVGTAEGAAPGLRLELFREGAQGQREVVNEAEVTDAGEGRSRARLRDERAPVAPGLKAEQLR
jgi:hypothetical protein